MSFLGDIDLKAGIKKIQNTVMNRSNLEIKVREATSNDPWGAPGTLKQEIAEATYNFEDSKLIMQTIWLRLADSGKNWRHVYKGLQLIEFLVGHGAERIIDECKDNINIVRSLKNFQYMDEKNKDAGQQVRELAVKTAKLLADDAAIVDMRKAAKKTKGKFEGISAEESRFHKSRGAYGDDDNEYRKKPSKYDDNDSPKPTDDDDNYKPKKKKLYDDDEDAAPAPKKQQPKNDDEFDAKFDDDEDAAPAPVQKQVTTTTRPRAASGGKQPAPVAKPQPQQGNNGLLDIDSFIGGPVQQQQTKQATTNYYMAPQVIDPFETPKPIAQPTNTAALNNAFDDNWDAQWQEGADQQSQQQQAEDSKPKNELFGFTSGLVNFDTLDDKKKPNTQANNNNNTQSLQQQQQQAKTKSMAELKAEKGGMIQPRQMTPTTTFVPTTTTPAPVPFGTRPAPATGFGMQPNPYGMQPQQPNPYGNMPPQQPNPYGYPPQQNFGMQPNPAFRGYPPQQPPQQQPMGRGNPNFNAFNF